MSGVSASSFQTTRPASAGSLRLAAAPVVLGYPRRRFRWAHIFGEAALGKAGTVCSASTALICTTGGLLDVSLASWVAPAVAGHACTLRLSGGLAAGARRGSAARAAYVVAANRATFGRRLLIRIYRVGMLILPTKVAA